MRTLFMRFVQMSYKMSNPCLGIIFRKITSKRMSGHRIFESFIEVCEADSAFENYLRLITLLLLILSPIFRFFRFDFPIFMPNAKSDLLFANIYGYMVVMLAVRMQWLVHFYINDWN